MKIKNKANWGNRGLLAALLVIISCAQCVDQAFDSLLNETGTIAEIPIEVTRLDFVPPAGECQACDFVVPAEASNIDGNTLKIRPGQVICLQAGLDYGSLRFVNLVGTPEEPITITNCGGKVFVQTPGKEYSIKILRSSYFRVTGGSEGYGVRVGGGQLGVTLDYLTSDFEIDHIEVADVGFAGIMAKTDPSCDDASVRDKFTMRNVSIHDNFVHATGGEGLYIGSSFYSNGVSLSCGTRLPHAIKGVRIYNNQVEFTGWDGIQLGAAVEGAEVFNNSIKFYGTASRWAQNSGIQIGEGTGGLCYNNFIKDGTGNGITMLGLGDNLTTGNVIINPGGAGIFCDDRLVTGYGFKFTDNIIINPGQEGIRVYSTKVPNTIKENVIINPPVFKKNPDAPLSTDYIFRKNTRVHVIDVGNTCTRNIDEVRDIYEAAFEFDALKLESDRPIGLINFLKQVRVN